MKQSINDSNSGIQVTNCQFRISPLRIFLIWLATRAIRLARRATWNPIARESLALAHEHCAQAYIETRAELGRVRSTRRYGPLWVDPRDYPVHGYTETDGAVVHDVNEWRASE